MKSVSTFMVYSTTAVSLEIIGYFLKKEIIITELEQMPGL
ncbi:hypothetical Protein YC6258_02605 [Gynuella sunshinyii YC6258]|uniref:Uncharacterized protein n=1 Tax=Gynuella sunshinyii YC6258 TaxID=1445510 RepID=A0A0C5VW06_9GAMM|nr:hypothetical Protein YC6258_02605 [Gynuella sunshinyii YC6258]